MHESEQGLASGSRTGTDTTGMRPAQLKQESPCGDRITPPNKTRALHLDRTLQHQVQLPQQRSGTSTSSPRQRSVAPPVLKASDSDDNYFNDEDNDALLAIEDSVMHVVGSCDTAAAGDSAQGRVCGAGQDRAVGNRPHVATAVNLLSTDY